MTSLSGNFEKLSGDNLIVRRIRGMKWRMKTVSLDHATLKYSGEGEPPKSLQLVPGCARYASFVEQMYYGREYSLVLKGVSVGASHDEDIQTVVFAFPTEDDLHQWRDVANFSSYDAVLPGWTPLEAPLITAWGHVPTVPRKYVLTVLRRLNFKLKIGRLEGAFAELFQKDLGKTVSIREFVDVILHLAKEGPAIRAICEAAGTERISPSALADALGISEHEVELFLAHNRADTCSPKLLIYFLYNSSNSIIDPDKAYLAQDMTQPLNHYVINSSHNTYLQGDQLQSDSSAQMYRHVLKRGCRCVEIDLWDGDDGKPIVKHGHTMTSPDTFENVLKVISTHSFAHGNHYPVILSIENHMSYEQQVTAATQIKAFLGDKLLLPETVEPQAETLPSPESMKDKILIKAKTGRSVLRASMSDASQEALGDLSGADMEDGDSEEDDESPRSLNQKKGSKSDLSKKGSKVDTAPGKIAAAMSNLVFLAGGNRTALMDLWKKGVSGKSQYMAASCVSLSEKKISAVCENKLEELIRTYNGHGLTRVYPKGTRVDSSNYTPTLAHYLGCQLVAMNWQGADSGLAVNEARFRANNGCGYVLWRSVVEPAMPGTLRLNILSAFLLPRPKGSMKTSLKNDIIDSYCSVKLYDAVFTDEDGYSSFKFESSVARSNGFSPVWQEQMEIPIKNRALSVILLKVYDRDLTSEDDLVGYCAIPVALIRGGIRNCPLRSKNGDEMELPGTSLCPSILCTVKWISEETT